MPPETAAPYDRARVQRPQQLEDAFRRHGDEIAAVIVEPVAGNMNFVPGSREFLDALRALCTQHGAVLIFDEVMTGFRVGPRGAQGLFGITPDLTTLGKVIGGGMPVGAFGGRRDIMEKIAPLGPVYQAGTLSGNPVAVAAGLATLKLVLGAGLLRPAHRATASLVEGLNGVAKRRGAAFSAAHVGGMFGVFFRGGPPRSFAEVMASRQGRVQPLLPRDARARRVSGAVGLRSGVRLVGARQGGNRRDGAGGGPGARYGRLTPTS